MKIPTTETRSLLFDLGRVLVDFNFLEGYRQLGKHSPYSADELPREIAATGLVPLLETGRITPEAFHDELAKKLKIGLSYLAFCDVWNSIFLPGTLIPETAIAGLARRYRLVLLSNTNSLHFESIQARYPVIRHFSSFVLSHKVGVMKPDQEIYRHAIAAADNLPAESVFIDDLPANVAGGKLAGIDSILFTSWEQLSMDFAQRGIAWR